MLIKFQQLETNFEQRNLLTTGFRIFLLWTWPSYSFTHFGYFHVVFFGGSWIFILHVQSSALALEKTLGWLPLASLLI